MSQKENKPKLKKKEAWNNYAWLANFARRGEKVLIHYREATDDVCYLECRLMNADNWTIQVTDNKDRELIIFKHAIRAIERIKQK